jgi:hypothetical protein
MDAAIAFHSASESLFLAPFFWASVQQIHYLDDFMSRIFSLSEERASQIESPFPRPCEDPVRSF